MKTIIFILFVSAQLLGQSFLVEETKGKALVIKNTSEKVEPVKKGEKLNGNDLVITEDNASVNFNSGEGAFVLSENSALELEYLRDVDMNELLLALAMDEIRSAPVKENNGKDKKAVVYGENAGAKKDIQADNSLGSKKMNAARQLSEKGYKFSAVLLAKDTFRKYPSTDTYGNREFVSQILAAAGLYREAYEELDDIKPEGLTAELAFRLNEAKLELARKLEAEE